MGYIESKRFLLSSLVVVGGVLFGSASAFAATSQQSWGYSYLNDGGVSGRTDTADMGAQTNSNYVWIIGGSQTISWGDGQQGTGGINEVNPGISWSNSDWHTYASPNSYYTVVLCGSVTLHNNYTNQTSYGSLGIPSYTVFIP